MKNMVNLFLLNKNWKKMEQNQDHINQMMAQFIQECGKMEKWKEEEK